MTKSSVSAPQFFALLYLSMLGSMFMYIVLLLTISIIGDLLAAVIGKFIGL